MATSFAAALKRTCITDASTPSETAALLFPLDRIAAWTWHNKQVHHWGLNPLLSTHVPIYPPMCVCVTTIQMNTLTSPEKKHFWAQKVHENESCPELATVNK